MTNYHIKKRLTHQYIIANDAVANHIFVSGTLGKMETIKLKNARKSKNEPERSQVVLLEPSEPINNGSDKHATSEKQLVDVINGYILNTFDKCVYNAVVTLYKNSITKFSCAMVYRVMNGLTSGSSVNKDTSEKVARSIDKMNRLTLKLFKEGSRIKSALQNPVKEAPLLSAENITLCHGNKPVKGYTLLAEPILGDTRFLITVDTEMLQIRGTRLSERLIVMRDYIIRRCYQMKRASERNLKMKYQTIIRMAGLKNTGHIQRDVKMIGCIMQSFTDYGYIAGYKVYERNGTEVGIEVILPAKVMRKKNLEAKQYINKKTKEK